VVLERHHERTGLSKAGEPAAACRGNAGLRGLLDGVEECSFATVQDGHFAMIPVDYDGWDTRFPFKRGIPQATIED
jgi:hypothetical protein